MFYFRLFKIAEMPNGLRVFSTLFFAVVSYNQPDIDCQNQNDQRKYNTEDFGLKYAFDCVTDIENHTHVHVFGGDQIHSCNLVDGVKDSGFTEHVTLFNRCVHGVRRFRVNHFQHDAGFVVPDRHKRGDFGFRHKADVVDVPRKVDIEHRCDLRRVGNFR